MIEEMEFIITTSPEVFNATTARLPYVRKIYNEMMGQSACSLPTPVQEKAYQDALAYVANALSKRTQNQGWISSGGLQACSSGVSTMKSRKGCLKDALNLLTLLERNRLYDPPSDNEIQYYLLIKKYAMSMISFFDACNSRCTVESGPPECSDIPSYQRRYECLLSCYPLAHIENVEFLVEHFADLAKCVLDLDITNCNLIRPSMSMGTKDSKETPESVVCRSTERSNVAYSHKFFLAALDLRTSELAFAPPEEDERLSYHSVLDVLDRVRNRLEDNLDIYSEELRSLYFERIYNGYSYLERHSKTAAKALLEKLYITESLESLLERANDYDIIPCLGKKLAEECEVPMVEMSGYITNVDWCIQIATMIHLLIHGHSAQHSCVIDYMEEINYPNMKKKIAWAALHAVTLSKYGCCRSDLKDHGNLVVFRDSPEEVLLKARRKIHYLGQGESENENLKILKGIVKDLRCIGESAVKPDKEERQLMNKIWQKAALSVHFFTCVMAFQQKRQVVQHGGLYDVNFLGLRDEKSKTSHFTGEDVHKRFKILRKGTLCFMEILEAYRQGLWSLKCQTS